MAEVDIREARKSYGSVQVLHGVDVRVPDGSFTVLVGPSGCGKSTLLRMIAGLEEITGGEIAIAGRVVNRVPPKERDIAMVFQNYALYPHMLVRENMAFSMRLAKIDDAIITRKVEEAAAILNLTDYLDRYPRQLSGGQRQRVAMGRAIVRDPSVFLFDEPLSNLDAKLRVAMRTEIKALHQRLGSTSIYVTHDQIEAMTMADQIVVMRDGRIEQIGRPLELYDRPNNLFVAGFIGSPAMNFIEGEVVSDGGHPALRVSADIVLPLPDTARTSEGARVTFGTRPDHLVLVDPETPGGIRARVEVVEPTGSETLVVSHMGDGANGAVAGIGSGREVLASFKDRHDLVPGQPIGLMPDLALSHLFDAEGRRISV